MQPLKLGVLGLGEATQILHLPALAQLPDLFTVTAVHDAVASVTETLAARLGAVPHGSVESLLSADLDAALIVGPNPLHAPWTLAALAQGLHVMIEKPMCMSVTEAETLAQAQGSIVVQIGYMRRHAPAFEEAVARIAPRRAEITFARVRDIIGMNPLFIDPTSHVLRGEVPEETVEVIYDTPYIRHQPARLRVTSQDTPQGVKVSKGYPSRQDAFIPEWQRFHAAITTGAPVKTDIADATQDHRLIEMIMAKLEG